MTIATSTASLPSTIAALFETAIGIERKAAAFYADMASAFHHVPEVSDFWQQLHREEIEHENILRGVYASLPPEMLAGPPEPLLAIQVTDACRLIDAVAVDAVLTLDDAYELAHDLEFSEVNAVFKLLAMAGVPTETHSRFVIDHIERHQHHLMEFGHAHGGRPWRRSIQARHAGPDAGTMTTAE